MTEISDLISNVGFPIVITLLLFYQNQKTIENGDKNYQHFSEVIDKNTQAINAILDKLEQH